jgi:hypothetical protein
MSGSLLSDARWRHLANNLPAGTILIAGRPDQARQNAILLRVARDLGGKGYRIATLTLPPPIY